MPRHEIKNAMTLVREAGAILVAVKADACREGENESLSGMIESFETAEAMIRELEALLDHVNLPLAHDLP
jgi:hypothetical protein